MAGGRNWPNAKSVRTKADLLVSTCRISVTKLFPEILRAFRLQGRPGGFGGRPVSTDALAFAFAPEQPAARRGVAPLGRPADLRGRLRIIGPASLRRLSL